MPARKTTTARTSPASSSAASKAGDPAETREPHEINSALASDRMQALLEDHRRMGARPAHEPAGDAHATSYPLKDK